MTDWILSPLTQLGRSILTHPMAAPPLSHFPPPGAGWPAPTLDVYRDPYRMDPMHQLRYPPGMMEAYRADEERAKAMYAHLRAKEPSPIPAPPNRLNPAVGSMKPSENAPARWDAHKSHAKKEQKKSKSTQQWFAKCDNVFKKYIITKHGNRARQNCIGNYVVQTKHAEWQWRTIQIFLHLICREINLFARICCSYRMHARYALLVIVATWNNLMTEWMAHSSPVFIWYWLNKFRTKY